MRHLQCGEAAACQFKLEGRMYDDGYNHQDDRQYRPEMMECNMCGMQVPVKAKICPYCGAIHYASKKAYDAAQRNMIIFAVVVFLFAALAFCH
jgi:rRNA maturation endonuclease Nob1